MNNLNKLRILITGGTGHLGSEIAYGMAKLGAEVIINGRNEKSINKLVNKIRKENLFAESAAFDLRNIKEVKKYFKNFSGPLNCIVSNAYQGKLGTIETIDPKEYINSLEISVMASHNLILGALPYLKKSVSKIGYASFINIASMYGVTSPDINIYNSSNSTSPPTYGVSKAGLIHWTKYAALEFGKYGIRINSVSPGPFPKNKKDTKFIETLSKRTGLKRIGEPKELVGPVSFLCSDSSSYITGSNLVVDGGWTSR